MIHYLSYHAIFTANCKEWCFVRRYQIISRYYMWLIFPTENLYDMISAWKRNYLTLCSIFIRDLVTSSSVHKDDTSHVRAITEFLEKDDIREVPEFTSWGAEILRGAQFFYPSSGRGRIFLRSHLQKDDNAHNTSKSVIKDDTSKTAVSSVKRWQRICHVKICNQRWHLKNCCLICKKMTTHMSRLYL